MMSSVGDYGECGEVMRRLRSIDSYGETLNGERILSIFSRPIEVLTTDKAAPFINRTDLNFGTHLLIDTVPTQHLNI